MKYLLLASILISCFISYSFSFKNTEIEKCDCETAANEIEKAESANEVVLGYADFQIFQLKSFLRTSQAFLKSKKISSKEKKVYSMTARKSKNGISMLTKLKMKAKRMKISDIKQFSRQMNLIHTKSNFVIESIVESLKLKNKTRSGNSSDNGIILTGAECSGAYDRMKDACFDGIKRMVECGVYATLGLQALQEDQENCTAKAQGQLRLCMMSGIINHDSYDEEMHMADQMCEANSKIVGDGKVDQKQTWDGF